MEIEDRNDRHRRIPVLDAELGCPGDRDAGGMDPQVRVVGPRLSITRENDI